MESQSHSKDMTWPVTWCEIVDVSDKVTATLLFVCIVGLQQQQKAVPFFIHCAQDWLVSRQGPRLTLGVGWGTWLVGRWQVITYSKRHPWVTRVKRGVLGVTTGVSNTQRTTISGSHGSTKSCSQVGLIHTALVEHLLFTLWTLWAKIVRCELVNNLYAACLCLNNNHLTTNPLTIAVIVWSKIHENRHFIPWSKVEYEGVKWFWLHIE